MANSENTIIPIERYGIKLISMGSLLDDSSPAILRGPMVTRATQPVLRQVDWSGLDYLILDLPPVPGTFELPSVPPAALPAPRSEQPPPAPPLITPPTARSTL